MPHEERILVCKSIEDVHEAITTLAVRGAPAIGIAAAYGMLLGLEDGYSLKDELTKRAEYLVNARPTAVNLSWAVGRILKIIDTCSPGDILELLEREAVTIHEEDRVACGRIGEHGVSLIDHGMNILTHCNAGALAVSELGTALAPIYCAKERNLDIHVYVDETRPLLQGARLTMYELMRAGVDCTLLTDNMAAHLMSQGKIDLVLVGADRIAANGDTANKIGTLNLAVLCQYFDIPFYVACPTSTLDSHTATGADIVIEERAAQEVTQLGGVAIAPEGAYVRNPAFDVTPASLITGIITEEEIMVLGSITS